VSRCEMVSVVLPCRNQADHIGGVLKAYVNSCAELDAPFELLVVPNASGDATQEVVETIARDDSRVRVVPSGAAGWGLAVRTGLDAARGEVLIYANSARTDPASIPLFVREYRRACERDSYCLVKARREARGVPLRGLGSMLYNIEARLCFGIRCQDVNGTPKVFSRDLYRSIKPTAVGDLFDLEMMRGVAESGVNVIEIPVHGFRRHGGKSSTTLRSAWRMYAGALNLWITRRAA
jgi:glycosyltransferase involved in cell wall biosynthesis